MVSPGDDKVGLTPAQDLNQSRGGKRRLKHAQQTTLETRLLIAMAHLQVVDRDADGAKVIGKRSRFKRADHDMTEALGIHPIDELPERRLGSAQFKRADDVNDGDHVLRPNAS